jgi:hypothetical protein
MAISNKNGNHIVKNYCVGLTKDTWTDYSSLKVKLRFCRTADEYGIIKVAGCTWHKIAIGWPYMTIMS